MEWLRYAAQNKERFWSSEVNDGPPLELGPATHYYFPPSSPSSLNLRGYFLKPVNHAVKIVILYDSLKMAEEFVYS